MEIEIGTKVLVLDYKNEPFYSGKVVALTEKHAEVKEGGLAGYTGWWNLKKLEIVKNQPR